MLGRKQRLTNTDWLAAVANIKNLVNEEDIKKAEKAAIADIKAKTKGKKTAYAYSGGKDSIVLSVLCQKAGVADCMIGRSELEYPAFIAWINENKPPNLETINTGQDMAWLARNQDMLFPNSQKAARWFSIVQHRAQTKYYKAKSLDMLIVGRRKADGNYVGKGDNIYTNGKGVTYYSPLADWSHEYILAYIAYNELPTPPIYGWSNGYKCGTHSWPARQHTQTTENGWSELFQIDPTLVEKAAAHEITSAKEFLRGRALNGEDNQS